MTRRDVIWSLIAVVAFAAWYASSPEVPNPIWSVIPTPLWLYPVFFGLRSGWDQRRRGPIRVVAAGIIGTVSFVALAILFDRLVQAMRPWARNQAWLEPVIFGAAIVAAIALT